MSLFETLGLKHAPYKNNKEVQKDLSSPYANISTTNKFILGGL